MLISACADKQTVLEANYYKLSESISTHALQLSAKKAKLRKTAFINEKKQLSPTFFPDWKKELKLFEDADLNKPAWRDSYSKDECMGVKLRQVTYRAIDDKSTIRKLELRFDKDKLVYVGFLRQSSNMLYTFQQCGIWVPQSYFYTESEQKVRLGDAKKFVVFGEVVQ